MVSELWLVVCSWFLVFAWHGCLIGWWGWAGPVGSGIKVCGWASGAGKNHAGKSINSYNV